MKRELIADLTCPYCTDGFEISHVARGSQTSVDYGLIRCSCFEFPIVDGVLLLSLSKGYGGAEEAIQPLVPLQAAAIEMIRGDRIGELQRWIKRHIPLLWDLMAKGPGSYLGFSEKRVAKLALPINKERGQGNRYEVLGFRALRNKLSWSQRLISSRPALMARAILQRLVPDVWSDWYVSRYLSGDLFELETLVETLPEARKILSICCGNGVFEVVAQRCFAHPEIVSVDGQLLNLFAVKRFFNPGGTYICHDVQFPLPFRSGYFDASFSSTCLQEIPSRAHFASEQLRVVADRGWSLFDSFWWPERRLNPLRYYRYLQNFSETADDTLRLLQTSARDAPALVCSYPAARDAAWTPVWKAALEDPNGPKADEGGRPTAFVSRGPAPALRKSSARTRGLMVNPYYAVSAREGELVLAKRGTSFPGLPAEITLEREPPQAELLKLYAMGVLMPELVRFADTRHVLTQRGPVPAQRANASAAAPDTKETWQAVEASQG